MQHYLCWADFTASIISPVKQVLVTRSELFNWNMCWAKYLFTSKASFGDSFRVGLTEVFAEIWNFLAWYTWYILSNLATENCVLKKKVSGYSFWGCWFFFEIVNHRTFPSGCVPFEANAYVRLSGATASISFSSENNIKL